LIEKGALRRKRDGNLQFVNGIADESVRAQTVDVPLVGTFPAAFRYWQKRILRL